MLARLFSRQPTGAAAPRGPKTPAVPAGLRVYAIGDIHGRADLLTRLMEMIEADNRALPKAEVVLVFLGDYIDRGPGSREVVSLVKGPHPMADRIVRLRGNHEEALLGFIEAPEEWRAWLDYGGMATLLSYGVRIAPAMPAQERLASMAKQLAQGAAEHRSFYESLTLSETIGDYFFVHAGVDPETRLADQKASDLTTIREPFLDWGRPLEKVVVHGHSIAHSVEFRGWRIGIDTGAYATGHLTCLVLEGSQTRILAT